MHEYDEDGEIMEKKIVYRPKTPDLNEEMLKGFDMRTSKITSLIAQ